MRPTRMSTFTKSSQVMEAMSAPVSLCPMVSLHTPICDFGWKAVDFDLPGVDGRRYRLADVRGKRGTLVMFICNHCPYVKAVRERIIRDVRELAPLGVGSIAV